MEDGDVEKEEDDDVEEEDRSQDRAPHYVRACAAEVHFNMSLDGVLQEKCWAPNHRPTLCASLRSRNACQHVRRANLYENLQVKAADQKPDPHFVRACTVEMHFNMSQ